MEIIARRWGVSVGRELLEALSTALKEALGDEKRREIMREANLAVVKERADWDKNFATLLKAYKRLSGEEH